MLQDLRRYTVFESQAIRPYTISAMSCWQRAVQLGYITQDEAGKVRQLELQQLVASAEVYEMPAVCIQVHSSLLAIIQSDASYLGLEHA